MLAYILILNLSVVIVTIWSAELRGCLFSMQLAATYVGNILGSIILLLHILLWNDCSSWGWKISQMCKVEDNLAAAEQRNSNHQMSLCFRVTRTNSSLKNNASSGYPDEKKWPTTKETFLLSGGVSLIGNDIYSSIGGVLPICQKGVEHYALLYLGISMNMIILLANTRYRCVNFLEI